MDVTVAKVATKRHLSAELATYDRGWETKVLECYHQVMADVDDGYDAVRAAYPPILNTAQVAELLAMNVQEVRRLSRDGRIPSRRIGKAYRYFRDEIVAWLNSSVGS